MVTIDLKDAYHLIPIAESSRKFLRFTFNGKLFEYSCLPFGLNTAPYVFTKIMRTVVAQLRERGHVSVIYLDDLLLMGRSFAECSNNLVQTQALLESLGFVINFNKSILKPTKRSKFLGFILDSEKMLIELPHSKRTNVLALINHFIGLKRCKIRELASFIGTLGSCCPGIKYGWVYLKDIERENI
jgi:Reverse transcriptase (RNA-dependent DNA polymerase).